MCIDTLSLIWPTSFENKSIFFVEFCDTKTLFIHALLFDYLIINSWSLQPSSSANNPPNPLHLVPLESLWIREQAVFKAENFSNLAPDWFILLISVTFHPARPIITPLTSDSGSLVIRIVYFRVYDLSDFSSKLSWKGRKQSEKSLVKPVLRRGNSVAINILDLWKLRRA